MYYRLALKFMGWINWILGYEYYMQTTVCSQLSHMTCPGEEDGLFSAEMEHAWLVSCNLVIRCYTA